MSSPLIKPLRTPNGYYCFDGNQVELLNIGVEEYEYLKKVEEKKIEFSSSASPLIQDHYLEGYFHPSTVREIKHQDAEYLHSLLSRKLSMLTLQVTQKCNFRCKYCVYMENEESIQRAHSQKVMEWDIAKNAVDFLWKHSVDSERVNVGFYGGEPLLEFGLIKRVVEYCKMIFAGKPLSFSITTNGTLLSNEIIQYFSEHEIKLMVSLDGTKEVNDTNRVFADGRGTYDAVMKSLSRLRETNPEYANNLYISMVMDPKNDFDCYNITNIGSGDFYRRNLSSTIVDKDYISKRPQYSVDYIWKYEYHMFLAYLAHFNRYCEGAVSPISASSMSGIVTNSEKLETAQPLREVDAPSGPCVPGQMRLFCDVNGRFFPCERVSESSEAMNIGNTIGGIDVNKAKSLLNVGAITSEECSNCWCFRLCELCAKKADVGKSYLSAEKKSQNCALERLKAEEKLLNYLLLKEIPVFYSEHVRKINTGGFNG